MRTPSSSSSSSSSPWIVAARGLLVALAAAAVVAGFALTRESPPEPIASRAVYVCPMHPAVTSAAPGECPICRMALERQAGGAASESGDKAPEPSSLTLGHGLRLAGFDSVSRVKKFESSFDMRAWAWADSRDAGAALYPRDWAELIKPGDEGLFEPQSGPRGPNAHGIKIRVTTDAPEPWDTANVLVRFRRDEHAGAELQAKEIGSIKLATRLRDDLVVKDTAVIQSPEGPYILIASEDRRTFTKRPVQIGSTLYEYASVVSGAREDEYAVALHTFVLDSERRFGRRGAP